LKSTKEGRLALFCSLTKHFTKIESSSMTLGNE